MISLIAAIANHRVIGHRGTMPWHLPAELAYFKKMTLGKPVLMGHRTFVSIGRPLPGRRNLVLSGQEGLCLPGCEVYRSLEQALAAVPTTVELMVMGGASLYQQALPLATRLYLTFIEADLAGDTYFPEWNTQEWREISRHKHLADTDNPFNFYNVSFERYLRDDKTDDGGASSLSSASPAANNPIFNRCK